MSNDMTQNHPPQPPEPGRAELREAMDLWREDAARAAARVDVTGDLADRVVAAARRGPRVVVPAGARWYAAAAVLLMAVGITGTLLARDGGLRDDAQPPRWADVEEALLDVLVDDPNLSPGLEGR